MSEFQIIDCFFLKDSCEERNATDMHSVFTPITTDGDKKTVRHYYGDLSALKKLTKLENKIDEIVNSNQGVQSFLECNLRHPTSYNFMTTVYGGMKILGQPTP